MASCEDDEEPGVLELHSQMSGDTQQGYGRMVAWYSITFDNLCSRSLTCAACFSSHVGLADLTFYLMLLVHLCSSVLEFTKLKMVFQNC